MDNFQETFRLAQAVREACEQYAFSSKAQDLMFYKDDDLQGMCGIASQALVNILPLVGNKGVVMVGRYYVSSWTYSMGHAWVETCVGKRKIIDLTATQFDHKEPVVIASVRDKRWFDKVPATKWSDYSSWSKQSKPTVRHVNGVLRLAKINWERMNQKEAA